MASEAAQVDHPEAHNEATAIDPGAKQNAANGDTGPDASEERPAKRAKLDEAAAPGDQAATNGAPPRIKGIAPIKAEYVSDLSSCLDAGTFVLTGTCSGTSSILREAKRQQLRRLKMMIQLRRPRIRNGNRRRRARKEGRAVARIPGANSASRKMKKRYARRECFVRSFLLRSVPLATPANTNMIFENI